MRAAVVAMLAAACATPLAAQDDSIAALRDAERNERIRQHQARLMPEAISKATIEQWKSLLELDADLIEHVDALREEYERRCAGLNEEHRRPIFELWSAAFRYDRDMQRVEPVPNPQLLDLYDEHLDLLDELLSADAFLFDAIRARLTPPQALLLNREHVKRLMSFVEVPVDARSTRVDVSRLVDALELEEHERAAIDPLLQEHFDDLVKTLTDAVPGVRERAVGARYQILVRLGPEWRLVTPTRDLSAFERTLASLQQPEDAVVDWLSEHNRRTVRRVEERLPQEKAGALFDSYLREVDPDLFEEVDQVHDYIRAWRERLPQNAEIADAITREVERLKRETRRATEDFFETLEYEALRLDTVTPISPSDEIAFAIARISDEIALLEFLVERRGSFVQATNAVSALVQAFLPEELAKAKSFHGMQEARQDADRWRISRLRERISQLLLIEDEAESDD